MMFEEEEELLPNARIKDIARLLAMAVLGGNADPLAIRQRCFAALGEGDAWLAVLTQQLVEEHGELIRARDLERLSDAIFQNRRLRDAFLPDRWPPKAVRYFVFEPLMLDAPKPLRELALPSLPTPGDLARWLGISVEELEWLADPAGWRQRHLGPLCHYRYRWVAKRAGGHRLLEIPKSQLRRIQRQILCEILVRVPIHDAAHGCVRKRSIFTNAAPHAAQASLLRIDLRGFFTSIKRSRVHAIFETLGYPKATAKYLAALTTSVTPVEILREEPGADSSEVKTPRQMDLSADYGARHLPQGAPTSPTLANLAAWRLDLRVAQAADASDARYTRFVDDMFYSSDSLNRRRMSRLADMMYRIILEEGFVPNFRKTRFMAGSTSQRVTGLTVNSYPNVSRRSYDQLKAILTNCAKHGPEHQNRSGRADFRSHLLGRIAFFEQASPARGAKLRTLMDRISWSAPKSEAHDNAS